MCLSADGPRRRPQQGPGPLAELVLVVQRGVRCLLRWRRRGLLEPAGASVARVLLTTAAGVGAVRVEAVGVAAAPVGPGHTLVLIWKQERERSREGDGERKFKEDTRRGHRVIKSCPDRKANPKREGIFL